MEKKIETFENFCLEYARNHKKDYNEIYSIAASAIQYHKNQQSTPSSLPTEEEIPKFTDYMTSVDSADIEDNDVYYCVDKDDFDSAVKKAYELGLRTNFSSEKYTIDKFIVFCTSEDHEDDVAQLSIPFNTYEEAENFKNSDYHKKAYPNAYILCTTIPNPLKQNG